jgi:sensor histidine kinase regulating citrate/malate metabolism
VECHIIASRLGAKKLEANEDEKLKELISLAVESMGVAVSVIDTKGTLLYYNKQANKILNRKPEYIGNDIHSHHKKATSNKKLDLMLQDFQKGRTEPFHYEAKPYGKTILVTISPILEDGKFIGCTQSAELKEDTESK